MGVKYLWDTNPTIYYLQQQFPKTSQDLMDQLIGESIPALSAITEIELLCWRAATKDDLAIMKTFIADSFVFELDQPIKEKTVEIRKLYAIKLPDAIIAATALIHNLILITRNTKDFVKIPNLEILNPYEVTNSEDK